MSARRIWGCESIWPAAHIKQHTELGSGIDRQIRSPYHAGMSTREGSAPNLREDQVDLPAGVQLCAKASAGYEEGISSIG